MEGYFSGFKNVVMNSAFFKTNPFWVKLIEVMLEEAFVMNFRSGCGQGHLDQVSQALLSIMHLISWKTNTIDVNRPFIFLGFTI